MTTGQRLVEVREVDLANTVDFALGPVRVRPSTLEVSIGERREILEPRIMQVFVALARRRGEVMSRDDLIKACWGGRAIGDDTINRCVARLRRLAEAEGGFTIETIPRVGYRLAETPPPKPAKAPSVRARLAHLRRFDLTKIGPRQILVVGVLFMMSVAGLLYGLLPGMDLVVTAPAAERVAVLPFATLSGETDVVNFSDAVANQIVGAFNDNEVQAVSRPNSTALRGPDRDEAAAKLGVAFILDGTVQRGDKGLHVTVHLDRTSTHATLWTASFTSADDPLEFQAQVAAKAVDQVKAALRAHGMNDSALTAYLSAQEFARLGGKEPTLRRRELLRTVVLRAPRFSLGHSGLAVSNAKLIQFAPLEEAEALRSEAEKQAKRALDLDARNGEAYHALAQLLPPPRVMEREALYLKGLAADPDEPTLNSSYAALLADEGRLERALELQQRAVMLDPLSPRKTAGLATSLAHVGRLAEARATIERASRLWPANPGVWMTRFYILCNFGYPEEARLMLAHPEQAPAGLEAAFFSAARTYVRAVAEGTPFARAAARREISSALESNQIEIGAAIEILAHIGDVNAAFALSDRAYAQGREPLPRTDILFRPTTASLRSDPRFRELMVRLKFFDHWAAGLPLPDFCAVEDLPLCHEAKRAVGRPGDADRRGADIGRR